MESGFPKPDKKFFKPQDFQDNEMILTFKGHEKKHNEDLPAKNGKPGMSWKDRLKFVLPYSYPEWAFDKTTGQQLTGNDGKPFRNRYWDPKFPQGYTIIYHFEEGQLDAGSRPLYEGFGSAGVKPGDKVAILRTGKEKDTKWRVRRIRKEGEELQTIQLDDLGGNSEEAPF